MWITKDKYYFQTNEHVIRKEAGNCHGRYQHATCDKNQGISVILMDINNPIIHYLFL